MTRLRLKWLPAFLLLMPVSMFAQSSADTLTKSSVIESNVVYLRVGAVGQNLSAEIQTAQQALMASNTITGTVLDLRFADGNDSDALKAVESLLAQARLPLAVLVNDETTGAAVQLAEDLRANKAGLIFGSSKELKPDIAVTISADAEKKLMTNPYGTISTNEAMTALATNDFLPYIDHTTEADLVREKIKDGDQEGDFEPSGPAAEQQPFIRDPVLARGVDFIKGMAALRWSHT
ncbi:MAG TPA: hypothetical protein VGI03_00430 [Verrucomicrobiae bacterium]